MVGPYRTAEARNLAERVCPWCNARIVVDLDAVTAVCDSCGARYATALARVREIRVVAERRRGSPAVRVLFALAYAAIGIGVAFVVLIGAIAVLGFVVFLMLVSAWSKELRRSIDRLLSARGD
jgi:ribosomal protein L40E